MAKLADEAKEYMAQEIAPTLTPSVKGNFSVRLIGIHHNHAEIELRIVDDNKQCVKSFGSKVIPIGRSITLKGLESNINFLPMDIKR